jgi:hypothetical protein
VLVDDDARHQHGELRDDVLAAAATVPGATEWFATRLAQLDVPVPAV